MNAYTAGVLTSAMQLGLVDQNLDKLVDTYKVSPSLTALHS